MDVAWAVVILAFSMASQGWVPGSGGFGGRAGQNIWARCGSSMCACEMNVPLGEHAFPLRAREKLCPLCPEEPRERPCEPSTPCDDGESAARPLLVLNAGAGLGVACPTDLASMGVSLCLLGLSRPAMGATLGPAWRAVAVEDPSLRPLSRALGVPVPPPRA